MKTITFLTLALITLAVAILSARAQTTYTVSSTGSGSFHPVQNYGTESQFQFAMGNFISGGGFLSTFSVAGDAMFTASLTVPEPTALAFV